MGDFQPSSGEGRNGEDDANCHPHYERIVYFPRKAIWCSGKSTSKYILSIYYVPG